MPPAKSNSKSSSTPGVKMFIAAASVAATLGGWALLSANEAKPAAQASTLPDAPQTAPQAEAATRTINLAPLPTLVPLAPHARLVTASNNAASRSIAQPAAPVQQAAPAQAAPAQAAPAPLALRVVSAPQQGGGSAASAPAPVTNTRSSR
jgi:hypothetical protein